MTNVVDRGRSEAPVDTGVVGIASQSEDVDEVNVDLHDDGVVGTSENARRGVTLLSSDTKELCGEDSIT